MINTPELTMTNSICLQETYQFTYLPSSDNTNTVIISTE